MWLVLASFALADDPAPAPVPKTYTPAPRASRTTRVTLAWTTPPYPRSASVDGEVLDCRIPCSTWMSPGEHELSIELATERTVTLSIDVPDTDLPHTIRFDP
ncbi:MAG: hypothetical protein H6738_24810 [Alphaproteobacteria bacterium]|nr:hypothetical protein [Alphaproteobacteria bacterium]MCB9700032.1 hypothetical protein [Alphaproteobacteria bacterium]